MGINICSNRFEQNRPNPQVVGLGVRIEPQARKVHILSNIFASDKVDPTITAANNQVARHSLAFNTTDIQGFVDEAFVTPP